MSRPATCPLVGAPSRSRMGKAVCCDSMLCAGALLQQESGNPCRGALWMVMRSDALMAPGWLAPRTWPDPLEPQILLTPYRGADLDGHTQAALDGARAAALRMARCVGPPPRPTVPPRPWNSVSFTLCRSATAASFSCSQQPPTLHGWHRQQHLALCCPTASLAPSSQQPRPRSQKPPLTQCRRACPWMQMPSSLRICHAMCRALQNMLPWSCMALRWRRLAQLTHVAPV